MWELLLTEEGFCGRSPPNSACAARPAALGGVRLSRCIIPPRPPLRLQDHHRQLVTVLNPSLTHAVRFAALAAAHLITAGLAVGRGFPQQLFGCATAVAASARLVYSCMNFLLSASASVIRLYAAGLARSVSQLMCCVTSAACQCGTPTRSQPPSLPREA